MIEETISGSQAGLQASPELNLAQPREQVVSAPEANTRAAMPSIGSTSTLVSSLSPASPVNGLTKGSQSQTAQPTSLASDDQEMIKEFVGKAQKIISDLASKPRDEEIAESGLNVEYLKKAKGLDIKQDQ